MQIKYYLKVYFANKNTSKSFKDPAVQTIIQRAVGAVNSGVAFKKSEKKITVIQFEKDYMEICLSSKEPLACPTKSVSGIARYIVQYYPNDFDYYQKTLFSAVITSEIREEDIVSTDDEAVDTPYKCMQWTFKVLYGPVGENPAEIAIMENTKNILYETMSDYIKKCKKIKSDNEAVMP